MQYIPPNGLEHSSASMPVSTELAGVVFAPEIRQAVNSAQRGQGPSVKIYSQNAHLTTV
ncbi:hypothetical protein PHLCEN_2v12403 [Hermanssonia centrifuga]|uniref:Uncharacterized protein n=1 Tax=Hermanssonia centrifuga TaxID=98765 RepID=A0A2R6NH72_9APHY|nr:hypothetical protein PHLCEN_2v12403 [Hermanssonia centrifuga]